MTRVTIGRLGAGAAGGVSSTSAGGVTISTFIRHYPEGAKALVEAGERLSATEKTSQYPSGTATVWFCFVYKGATPKVTTVEVNGNGSEWTETDG